MTPTRRQVIETQLRNLTTEELIRVADSTLNRSALEVELLERLILEFNPKLAPRYRNG